MKQIFLVLIVILLFDSSFGKSKAEKEKTTKGKVNLFVFVHVLLPCISPLFHRNSMQLFETNY